MPRKQTGRLASLSTPLGEDVLVLTRFEASERLSTPFEIRVTAESDQASVDLKPLIGAGCSVTLDTYGDQRYFHGLAVEAQWSGGPDEDKQYVLVLRPTLWLLTQASDCKIFANMTVPDIIKQVFSKHGLSDYDLTLSETYPVLEYCVQYNETDFSFVSRLMERYGIYYFFRHTDSGHTLKLVDSSSGHASINDGRNLVYLPGARGSQIGAEHLGEFTSERRLRSGKLTLVDVDFLQVNADMKADDAASTGYQHGDKELFRFPGKYPRSSTTATKRTGDGTTLAEVGLSAIQALDQRRYADGDAASLFPGGWVLFGQAAGSAGAHPEAGQYLVVGARHGFETESYRSGPAANDERLCRTSVELQPNDRVFRAPLDTPRPVIHGPQTALVVGENGEEIDVDQYGRVLLRFFWDRENQQSRRVRTAQMWSGSGWGGQFIPRVSQEVVVEFLDGDPDRPLIVGTVYNGSFDWPYKLPDNKTMSGLKSNSSKGGSGYNEFMFEDKKGSETVRLHAQRDHEITVLNSETRTIGASFEKSARGDPSRTTSIEKGDDTLTVAQGNLVVTVEQGDHTTTVSTGNHVTAVKSGNQTNTVSAGDQSTTVSAGNRAVEVSAGNQTVKIGQSLSVTANLKIELTVGPSTITLDPSGVTIKAPMIQLQADAMLKTQAPMIQVNADGVLMLKGAVTMIN